MPNQKKYPQRINNKHSEIIEAAQPIVYDPSKGINAFNADQAEKILIAMSYNEAARQIRAGTASASTINHFLKLGSVREEKERLKIEQEIELSRAKINKISEDSSSAADSRKAIEAFKGYLPSSD